jgi:hypothetical protein
MALPKLPNVATLLKKKVDTTPPPAVQPTRQTPAKAPKPAKSQVEARPLNELVAEKLAQIQEERRQAEAYFKQTGKIPPAQTTPFIANMDATRPEYPDGTPIEIPGYVLRVENDPDMARHYATWGATPVKDSFGTVCTNFAGTVLKIPVEREAMRQAQALAAVQDPNEETGMRIAAFNQSGQTPDFSLFQPTEAEIASTSP